MKTKESSLIITVLKIVIPLLIGIGIAFITPPEGLERPAMIYMGIFVCTIIWLVLDVIADYIAVILALSAFVVFNVTDLKTAFAPFADSSVWLVIGAFAISAVIAKCGLLKRVAFSILKLFPENYTGQITALFTTGLIISPMIPSLTAKAAILAPFANAASKALGYAKSSKAAAGMFCATWIAAGILGCAFLSGAVPVFTILGFLSPEAQAEWTWIQWFLAALVWLIVILLGSFAAVLVLYNPKKDKAAEAMAIEKGFAKKQLADLGPMTRDEKLAAVFLTLALLGWIFGKQIGINSAIWALIIMGLMAIFGLMTPKDFTTRISWTTVFFIGGVFSLAAMITKLSINTWLAGILSPVIGPLAANPFIFVAVIVIATYLIRLVIISQTATTAIFFAALGGICIAAGIDPWVMLFTCYMSTLVWHFSFTNTTYVAAIGSTNGEMVEHKDTLPMNFAYMGINLVACLASVPVWQLMGML
ncbi:MAG TPA: hypothetical protein DEB24_04880 [Coriobacteriia bacterium]|nr:hypothetical protein [Coriobacteriia bacterium]